MTSIVAYRLKLIIVFIVIIFYLCCELPSGRHFFLGVGTNFGVAVVPWSVILDFVLRRFKETILDNFGEVTLFRHSTLYTVSIVIDCFDFLVARVFDSRQLSGEHRARLQLS